MNKSHRRLDTLAAIARLTPPAGGARSALRSLATTLFVAAAMGQASPSMASLRVRVDWALGQACTEDPAGCRGSVDETDGGSDLNFQNTYNLTSSDEAFPGHPRGPTFLTMLSFASFSRASYGNLGAKASVSFGGTNPVPASNQSSSGYAAFQDTLTVTSPGLAGTPGMLRLPVAVSGTSTLVPPPSATQSWNMWLQYRRAGDVNWGGGLLFDYHSELPGYSTSGNTVLNVHFVFDEPLHISASLAVQALFGHTERFDGPVLSGQSELDMSHSARLMGITQVFDSLGNPVTFSVSSISGADYSQPMTAVPEPGGWLLWLAGVAVLLGKSWRRGMPRPDQ